MALGGCGSWWVWLLVSQASMEHAHMVCTVDFTSSEHVTTTNTQSIQVQACTPVCKLKCSCPAIWSDNTGTCVLVCRAVVGVDVCLCLYAFSHITCAWFSLMCSLVPRLLCGGGGRRAWYTLFTHAPSSLAYYSTSLKLRSFSAHLLKDHTAGLYSLWDISGSFEPYANGVYQAHVVFSAHAWEPGNEATSCDGPCFWQMQQPLSWRQRQKKCSTKAWKPWKMVCICQCTVVRTRLYDYTCVRAYLKLWEI